MGKPFARELDSLPDTINWANELDIEHLTTLISKFHHPVYIVGSGGSYSACVYAADLLTAKGVFAKAVTPLELFYAKPTLRKSNLIFISASGRNTDILFAFKKAIESEPVSIVSLCMRKNTKLAALSSNYSSCITFEFTPPTGKDGFLATNSLAAYFVILYKCILNQKLNDKIFKPDVSISLNFIKKTNTNTCFTILYGSYHHSVAIDLESKFSEAGLAPSLLSDFRHFAHGRHQWFDKRKDSAVIALTCPLDEKLCKKTLDLLPAEIPKLVLNTSIDNFEGTIHLLVQAMDLILRYGKIQGIDPGRPGVPEYGSKIYHLRYEKLIANQSLKFADTAILRKAKVNRLKDINPKDYQVWQQHYFSFIKKIEAVKFGGLIFDYDGTLCSPENRFNGIGADMKSLLIDFLKKGFVVGIVSGRGQSLRKDLEKVFKGHESLMKNVIIGYYNGSDIAPLTNSKHPNKDIDMHPTLKKIAVHLSKLGIQSSESPNQLTFGSKTTQEWGGLKDILLNELMLLDLEEITMVESSHSIDIIPRRIASKNHILSHCKNLCKLLGLATEVLCIGDKGQWPGNDFELLANEFALSVGEVSSILETGWNICPPGLRDEKATTYLMEKIIFKREYFTLLNI